MDFITGKSTVKEEGIICQVEDGGERSKKKKPLLQDMELVGQGGFEMILDSLLFFYGWNGIASKEYWFNFYFPLEDFSWRDHLFV